uniref:Cp12-domain-containing protein n=1 Tax=Tetraselmis sp. GSL018 TaxID=582737 RepID=A0A061SAD2_9CHLO|mmetsp:Transcript_8827/g.21326  ORF Transcript_8827/g.21326 Transcript_8827/m.21326 type:complete len:114 (+) Transcript_8827:148-489(+)
MPAFAFTATTPVAARAAPARAALRARVSAPVAAVRPRFVVRAEPSDKSPIETAIENAQEVCEGDDKGECAAAWDEVEELSAEAAHKRAKGKADPLEEFCDDNPDADECRVYED